MNTILNLKIDETISRLFESQTKADTTGNLFATDECGSIVIKSAVNGNYGFFADLKMVAGGVENDRIMEALCDRRLTDAAARRWSSIIDKLLIEAQSEYDELQSYQPIFLGDFAPKELGCFKKADKLLKESSFTIKKCMDILEEFTKKPKNPRDRKLIEGYGRDWTMSHTILASKTPQTHLNFMYESFTSEGQQLIESLNSLMRAVDGLMDLCCQTLESEERIKTDPQKLKMIHDRQFKDIKSQIYDLIKHLKDYPIDEMSVLKKNNSWDDFLKMAYHKFKDDIMKKYTVYQIIIESNNKNIDNDFERAYLLDDDKRYKVRYAIENFDDMTPKGRDGVLSSFHLAALYVWCDINCPESEFYDYFWQTYKGKFHKVSYTSFSDMISKIYGKNKQPEKVKKYEKFKDDMKKNGFYL